jgi:iron complex outermembrane receptor protein
MKRSQYLILGGAIQALLTAQSVFAQDSQANQPEDIIVTATRRDTRLQETPVTITALSGEQLQEQRIQNADDLLRMIPNARSASVNGIDKIPSIRGLNVSDSSPGIDRPISVFIDDVYYSNGTTYLSDLYDVEQLQVLRGPQGTTFGRNATGGAIVVNTRRPEFKTDAAMTFTARSAPGIEFGGFYNGEIVPEVLAGRITVSVKRSETTAENVAEHSNASKYLGGQDITAIRGQLRWTPGPSTDIRLNTSLTIDGTPALPTQYILIGQSQTTVVPMWPTDPDKFSTKSPQNGNLKTYAASLTLEQKWDWATLTSISAYRRTKGYLSVSAVPEAAADLPPLFQINDLADRQFSQEFRLTSPTRARGLEWIVGAYYLNLNDSKQQNTSFNPAPGTVFAAVQPPAKSFNYQRVRTESIAGFVEGVYHFTPAIGLRVGGRYTHERKAGRQIHGGMISAVNNPSYDVPLESSYSAFTPRFIVEVKPAKDIFLFAGASRGFKGGGWSMNENNPARAIVPVRPEKVWSYEGGIKSSWFDRRLQLNVTVFRAKTTDLQARVYDPLATVYRVLNAATVRSQGVEVEAVARPIDGLTLQASYGYLDSRYLDFPACTPGRNCAGLRTPFAPKNSFNLMGIYRFELNGGSSISVNLSTQFASKIEMDPVNDAVPLVVTNRSKINGMTDASLSWTSSNKVWKLTAWGKNITNRRPVAGGNNVAVFALSRAELVAGHSAYKVIYAEPVSYGFTLSWAM